MGSHALRRAATCVSVVLAASCAIAQDATEGRVAAWIVKAWNPGESLPKDRCFRVRYTIENRFLPPADEIQRLRTEVRAALDHPQKRELAMYESRLRGERDTCETDVWCDPSSDAWRVNRTISCLGQSEFTDFARKGDTHWCLTVGQLIVGSPSAPEPGYDYSQMLGGSLSNLHWLMSGGMWTGYVNRMPNPVVRLETNGWVAETEDEARGLLFRAKGVWHEDLGIGSDMEVFVRQQRGQPDDWEVKYVSSGRRHIAEVDFWVPERVEVWQGTPLKLDHVYRFTGFEFVEAEAVDALAQVPEFDGSDPIRGKITIASVLDLRGGVRGYHKVTESGREFIPIGQTDAAKHYRRLKWYGWISAGVVGGALVVLRLRRRMISNNRVQGPIA